MKSYSALIGASLVLAFVAAGCGSPSGYERYDGRDASATTDYRRRPSERVYEVPVASTRAVLGTSEKHCWVEREQVSGGPNVGGAIAGAVVGGIIGHQIGAGRGRDVATVGGAAVGGAVGANAGRRGYDRDVEHCETVANAAPDYWDITYDFRGVEHHVQMTSPPGRTITVNRYGEPRV